MNPDLKTVRLYSVKAIAKLLGVSRMQVYRWIKLHPFPKSFEFSAWSTLSHRSISVRPDAVIKWAKELISKHHHKLSGKTLRHLRSL